MTVAPLQASWLCLGGSLAWGAVGAPSRKHRAKPVLRIKGSVKRPLYPGLAAPLRLTVVNRRGRRVRVGRLRIRAKVDKRHRRAGCRRGDYAVRQVRKRKFPLRIRAHGKRRVRARVRMKNLKLRNQDACKGAKLKLRYRARTRR